MTDPFVAQEAKPLFSDRSTSYGTEQVSSLLLFHAAHWNHRVVTKLAVIDEESYKLSASVDFTVPSVQGIGTPDVALRGLRLFVPVVSVPKLKIADLTLHDENGKRLPALSREHEVQILVEALLDLWREYTGGDLRTQLVEARELLPDGSTMVVTGSASDVLAELVALGPREARRRLGWFLQSSLLTRLTDEQRNYFTNALRVLVYSGVIHAVVQDAVPLERRILKVSFRRPLSELAAQRHRRGFRWSPWNERLSVVRRLSLRADTILQSVGIRSTTLLLFLPATGGTASYHFESSAPDGLLYLDSLLSDQDGYRTLVENRLWSARFHVRRLDSGDPSSRHVHLYRRSQGASGEGLTHALYLRTPPTGWSLAALVTTFVIAVAVTGVAVWIRTLSGIDRATTAASAMLALGAIAVVILVRPLEHSFTSKLLRGARCAVALSAASALVSIAALLRVRPPQVNGDPGDAIGPFLSLRWVCVSAAWLAVFLVVLGWLSWYFSVWRLRRLRRARSPRSSRNVLAP